MNFKRDCRVVRYLLRNFRNSLLFVFALCEQGTAEERYEYPLPDPLISWQLDEARDSIEYRVCSDSEIPRTFRWDAARFGAAHNCLLREDTCASRIDTFSNSVANPSQPYRSTDVWSSFLLDGKPLGDTVRTRVWCDDPSSGRCETGSASLSLTLVRRSIIEYFVGDPVLCAFPEPTPLELPTIRLEIELATSPEAVSISAQKVSSGVGIFLAISGEILDNDREQVLDAQSMEPSGFIPLSELIDQPERETLASIVDPEAPAIVLLEEGFGSRSGAEEPRGILLQRELFNRLVLEAIVVQRGRVLGHFGVDGVISLN